jgi:hypothetical protein
MSVQALIKNKQNRLLSKTWRTALTSREVERNNYHVTGDLKRAREFARDAAKYKVLPLTMPIEISEPVVIYSREMVRQAAAL